MFGKYFLKGKIFPSLLASPNSVSYTHLDVYKRQESYRILTPKAKRYVYKSEINDGLKAPISAGEKVGTMTLSSEGEDIITVDLIVKHDVEQANLFTRIIRAIENTFRTIATMIRQ